MEYFAHLKKTGMEYGIGLDFSYGNGILYWYENLPEKFNKEMYFVIVVALLPGEASIFAFNSMKKQSKQE